MSRKKEKIKKLEKESPTKLTKSDKITRQIQRGFDLAKKWMPDKIIGYDK